jgi:hypothetical protein
LTFNNLQISFELINLKSLWNHMPKKIHVVTLTCYGASWILFNCLLLEIQHTITCLENLKTIRTIVWSKEIRWIHSNTRLDIILTCSDLAACYSIMFPTVWNVQLHVYRRRNQLKGPLLIEWKQWHETIVNQTQIRSTCIQMYSHIIKKL